MKTGASFKRGKSKQDYQTPVEFVMAVIDRYGPLAWDLAAADWNSLTPDFYSLSDNSLVQSWHKIQGRLWLNPPFNDIAPWARKCREEALLGAEILFLIPASVGSEWFAKYVYGASWVNFLRPRLSFDGENSYPKDCMLCHYIPRLCLSGYSTWKWK